MLIKPDIQDIKILFYYLGKIIIGIGFFAFVPVVVAMLFKEIEPLMDFLLTSGLCFLLGSVLCCIFRRIEKDLNWMHGMLIVCIGWLVAMFLGAIPLYLSRHYQSFLDACFEAMSGLATTGLTLVMDLDHLSFAHNFWRHLLMFMGGQGIVIVAISFLTRGSAGAFKMYVGEAREERILPSVIATGRFIWLVSIIYLILGVGMLFLVGIKEGMSLQGAIFGAFCIFMAGFDTGGFSPYSQNILYYHSILFEFITLIIMILGTINFKLHYYLWSGNRREIIRNIETKTFFFSLISIFSLVILALVQNRAYSHQMIYFRRALYQVVSAHTGTGFSNLYVTQFVKEWPALAILGIILAMGFGGGSCSTTGGIKVLRLGLIFKTLTAEVKKILLPQAGVVVEKFHHTKEVVLEDKQIRSVLLITLCYIGLYFLGSLIGVALGYPFLDALFESISASANVGLSTGITQVGMPALLKVTYILQMWIGRLEFMSIFILIGFLISAIKGR